MTQTVNDIINRVDEEEIVKLISDMVAIPSANEEKEVAEFVVNWYEDQGFDRTYLQEFSENRANAVGVIEGASDKSGESITFNGHLDNAKGTLRQLNRETDEFLVYGDRAYTPPWQTEVTEVDNRLMGLGVNNDKGPLAIAMVTAKEILHSDINLNGDLVVAGCGAECPLRAVDEFQGPGYLPNGSGTRHLIMTGIGQTDYGVILETSQMGVKWGNPGILELKLTVRGEQAYVPYTNKIGVENNPIVKTHELIEFISEWGKQYTQENVYEYPAGEIHSNVTIGAIRSGHPVMTPMQPGVAFLYVDIRVPPNRMPKDVEDEFRRAVEENVSYDIDVENYYSQRGFAPAHDKQLAFAEKVTESHRSVFNEEPPDLPPEQHSRWHDTNIYHEMGIPTVAYAPGPGGQQEYTDEFHRYSLSREEIMEGVRGYAGLALEICGTAP